MLTINSKLEKGLNEVYGQAINDAMSIIRSYYTRLTEAEKAEYIDILNQIYCQISELKYPIHK